MDDVRPEIPVAPVRLFDQLRRHMRDSGYAWKTEKTCLHWIRRFILFHGKQHPATLSAMHISQFLSNMANERHCSPATQRIALNTLVYLYKRFLSIELEQLDFNKAQPKRRLPVVLTHGEVYLPYALLRKYPKTAQSYDLRTIQKLLGHSDVKTTEIYTHVLGRGAMGVLSPLDNP